MKSESNTIFAVLLLNFRACHRRTVKNTKSWINLQRKSRRRQRKWYAHSFQFIHSLYFIAFFSRYMFLTVLSCLTWLY